MNRIITILIPWTSTPPSDPYTAAAGPLPDLRRSRPTQQRSQRRRRSRRSPQEEVETTRGRRSVTALLKERSRVRSQSGSPLVSKLPVHLTECARFRLACSPAPANKPVRYLALIARSVRRYRQSRKR